jgi:anti-sigma regulatory factor (Ser/Thr protein kinase)
VLYTDGLVEDPATPLDEGMRRLAEVAAEGAALQLGVEDLADLLLRRLVPGDRHDDDVAVLVLGVGAPITERTLELTDDPAAVRSARRAAEEVASSLGDEDLRNAVGLLVSEVVTNAVRHVGTATRLRVRASGRRVRVEVFDGGPNVLDPRPNHVDEPLPDRGRGLHLVESLADAWGVEPTGGGKCVWFEVASHETAPPVAARTTPEVTDGPPH